MFFRSFVSETFVHKQAQNIVRIYIGSGFNAEAKLVVVADIRCRGRGCLDVGQGGCSWADQCKWEAVGFRAVEPYPSANHVRNPKQPYFSRFFAFLYIDDTHPEELMKHGCWRGWSDSCEVTTSRLDFDILIWCMLSGLLTLTVGFTLTFTQTRIGLYKVSNGNISIVFFQKIESKFNQLDFLCLFVVCSLLFSLTLFFLVPNQFSCFCNANRGFTRNS